MKMMTKNGEKKLNILKNIRGKTLVKAVAVVLI